jgi:hypothetical protein
VLLKLAGTQTGPMEPTTTNGVTFLDASLSPVWSIPYPWAFGAGFDVMGNPLFLSVTFTRLYDANTYRDLIR